MPKNPARGQFNRFDKRYFRMADEIIRDVRQLTAIGYDVEAAVTMAWRKNKVPQRLEKYILDGVIAAAGVGGAEVTASIETVRRFHLDQIWAGSEMPLSSRIWMTSAEMQNIIKEEIKTQFRRGAAVKSFARSVDISSIPKGDIAGVFRQLEKLGRRAVDPSRIDAYKRLVRKAEGQISRLVAEGAQPSRLQKAYANVIKATTKQSDVAMDKAIVRAVKAKARYNAERVARTEIARAYGQAKTNTILKDDDVVGYRSVLSSEHPTSDVCDFHADADLYGMGPGVYPKDNGPPYPYHPGCLCRISPVHRGETGVFDESKGEKYLSSLSDGKKKDLLGVAGAKKFKENPSEWGSILKNYNGQEIKEIIEVI